MRKVTKIDAASNAVLAQRKLRVAAYCRVSTDSDEQLSSLGNQRSHYSIYIQSNPDWEFAGLYYDEGLSGTKKENRAGLLRLIRDCENRKVDMFLTKSISRFARNTRDCLEIVRQMTDLGVAILFEKENINTGTMDSELILSILSSLAAEESVSISQNNKWGIKRRFQNGTFKLSSPPYSYDYDGQTLIPNQAKALIVKRIFAEILAGNGASTMATKLNADGIAPPRGKQWTAKTILGMLENEKYVGDVLHQKTYTDDSFTRKRNHGEEDQYYIPNHHEAIISREDFEAAARILEQRGKEKNIRKGDGKYSNRYAFSGKIICGACGSTFKRRIHSPGKTAEYVAWCCNKHIDEGSLECPMIFVRDQRIKEAFVIMWNRLFSGRNTILKPLIEELKDRDGSINQAEELSIEKQIQEHFEQVQVLTGLMSKGYLEPALFNEKNNLLQAEIMRLREQRAAMLRDMEGERSAIHEAELLLKHLSRAGIQEEYSDELFLQYAEGITVFSPTEVGFRLKCGLTLRERMER